MELTRAIAFAAVLVAGCDSAPPNEGKRIPKTIVVSPVAIPEALSIPVTVDGAPRSPITRETLVANAPDWADHQRRAWSIARLVGIEATEHTTFAITNTRGITVNFPARSAGHSLVPALLLSQRGGIVAEFIDPGDPFPRFHGEGGRLGRSPEQEPRVSGVIAIHVRRSP